LVNANTILSNELSYLKNNYYFFQNNSLQFNNYLSTSTCSLSNFNRTFTFAGSRYNTALGNTILSDNFYCYSIILGPNCSNIMIGLAPQDINKGADNYSSKGFYIYTVTGVLYGQNGNSNKAYAKAAFQNQNTIYTIFYSPSSGDISFNINGIDYGVAFTGFKNLQLYPAVQILTAGSVTLLNSFFQFDSGLSSSSCVLNNYNKTFVYSHYYYTALGNRILSDQFNSYSVILGPNCSNIMIGLAPQDINKGGYNYTSKGFYIYTVTGVLYGQNGDSNKAYAKAGFQNQNTIYTIFYSPSSGDISFNINGIDYGVAFTGFKNLQLFPAVQILTAGSVTII
jgi:hypothetical protein